MQLRQKLLETVYHFASFFATALIKLLCCSYNVFYFCLRTPKYNTLAYTYTYVSFKNRNVRYVSSSLDWCSARLSYDNLPFVSSVGLHM